MHSQVLGMAVGKETEIGDGSGTGGTLIVGLEDETGAGLGQGWYV